MVHSLFVSSSGMRNAFGLLNTSAHNTANVNTDGYKKKEAILREAPGGANVEIRTTNSAGPLYRDFAGNIIEASNVDVASEVLTMMVARHMFSVNAAAFKASNEMHKSLVDTFA